MLKKFGLARALAATALLLNCAAPRLFAQDAPGPAPTELEHERLDRFERELEHLRSLLKIPGMSAAIVKDGRLLWARGFGYSDYENKIAATPDTPYSIASLTKTFGATLLMQLVEQGKVSLDDPMSKYSAQYKDDLIKVRHVLTHTSGGAIPGETYEYNGNLYGNLFDVIVKASGKRFRPLLVQNILEKLGTTGTSPGNDVGDDPTAMSALLGADNEKNYVDALRRLAKPYKLYGSDEIIRTNDTLRGLSPASGIVSTVNDLAKYDDAIDRNLFVTKETQQQMWTPTVSTRGQTLPYGLGWFVQNYRGLKLVWHYGQLPDLYSSLILKVPEKRITLILLANSDALSAPFRLGRGDVMKSAFACSFIRSFLFEGPHKLSPPEPRWGASDKDLLKGLRASANGYGYECEVSSNGAIRVWLEARRAEAHKVISLDPKISAAYSGQYQVGDGAVFTILSDGGKLIRQGKTQIELFPESETEFFAKAVDARFIFIKEASGRITGVKIRQGEREVLARRVSQ